jgi:membrane protease YdiL (CAAX protease family)
VQNSTRSSCPTILALPGPKLTKFEEAAVSTQSIIILNGFPQNLLEGTNLPDSPWVTFALFGLAAIILIISGSKNKAQVGILLVVALVAISSRLGLTSLAQMGFVPPENWLSTVLLALLIGSGLSLLSIIVIQPLCETITNQTHNVGIVEGVRGNWKALLSWLALIWTVVAFGEEILFHGFMMSQLIKLLGTGYLALVVNVLLTNVVFGLAHAYQGRSGTWSTGVIGVCLCALYIWSGYNLWLPILTHGMIDTVELVLMSRGADRPLRELIWKKQPQPAS